MGAGVGEVREIGGIARRGNDFVSAGEDLFYEIGAETTI
jgi:hypothetical protein